MNPWLGLPARPDYICAVDRPMLVMGKFRTEGYRFDAFPDPFVGNFQTAQVLFLSLNPGFKDSDVDINLQSDIFLRESIKSVRQEADARFFYWLPELETTHGFGWWSTWLGSAIREHGITRQQLLRNMMQIEYIGYHSERYHHNRVLLPSQQYSFDLVREAIRLGKVIVLMRSNNKWYDVIPELQGYAITLNNTQKPWISRANMSRYNDPGAYDRVIAALLAS